MVEDPKDLVSSRVVKKLHKYVESYENLSFHTEKGADEQSFIVYAAYSTKIRGIKTPAPGMSQYYIVKKGQSYLLYNNEKHYTAQMKNALNAGLATEKVKQLIKETVCPGYGRIFETSGEILYNRSQVCKKRETIGKNL